METVHTQTYGSKAKSENSVRYIVHTLSIRNYLLRLESLVLFNKIEQIMLDTINLGVENIEIKHSQTTITHINIP